MATPTSVKYLFDIDLAKNNLLNAKLNPVSTAEKTTLASTLNSNDKGLVVYDKDVTIFYAWDGNAFKPIGLTDAQYAQLALGYNSAVTGVSVTNTNTVTTVTLNSVGNSPLVATFNYAYIHDQSTPSASWTVLHNLGKFPSVTIVDTANSEIIGEVNFVNNNTLTISFSASFSGKAYIN